ncbi:MAG: peptidylprolyl isomerase [Planctomycetes bacterium]|nr:peptidylprolyl isomerase [Planctomycetota bacterium]
MKRLVCSALAFLPLFTACGTGSSTPPPAAPAKAAGGTGAEAPAKPAAGTAADAPAKPADAPVKAPVDAPKDVAKEMPKETPKAAAKVDMDADIKTLMAKAEQPDENIQIQHVLIAFKGVPRVANVTRSKEEAKALAEKVYADAVGGADFLGLVKQYTNDSAPGIYPMTKAGRAGMVKGFGDVGFRLKVGEIGVAPWEATASPFGWHIIKRVK